jgi:hypothetical protein
MALSVARGVARQRRIATTVLAVINHDPKHGRWILPLIIVAMVVLTYTFVQGIEPTESPTGSVGSDDPPFPTTPTSSTTTLPTDIAAFMVTLDIFENQLEAFGAEASNINANWESRSNTFGETRQALLDLQIQLEGWENSVAQVDGVPNDLAEGHVALVIEVSDLAAKIDDIILGLEAPDDGTLRRTAMSEYGVEVDEVAAAIQAIRDTATAPGPTTETTVETTDA